MVQIGGKQSEASGESKKLSIYQRRRKREKELANVVLV
jgi:hypothetical protein